MLDSLPHNQFIRLLVTLWAIWHARRKAIHEAVFQSPRGTHEFIERFFICEINAIKPAHTIIRHVSMQVMAGPTWVAPPVGSAKVKVDGAVGNSSNHGYVSAICIHAQGNYLGSSALVFAGVTDPDYA